MLKMLSNSKRFNSNNLREIQSFEKRIIFEYLKKATISCGFIFPQEKHSTIQNEKNGTMRLRGNSFSHTVKAILAESLLFS